MLLEVQPDRLQAGYEAHQAGNDSLARTEAERERGADVPPDGRSRRSMLFVCTERWMRSVLRKPWRSSSRLTGNDGSSRRQGRLIRIAGAGMSSTRHCHLQNQKALVTGATFGIGRAIAIHLASEGAEVIVHGRDTARGAGTVEAISAAGGLARFVAADLTDPAEIRRLAEDVGDIDILVNNAAFSVWRSTADLDVESFDAMFASNVRAPFLLVAAFAPGTAHPAVCCHPDQPQGEFGLGSKRFILLA